MKYVCTATSFSKTGGKLVPDMEKSSTLSSKTALKSYIDGKIDEVDADSTLVNVQFLVRHVVED